MVAGCRLAANHHCPRGHPHVGVRLDLVVLRDHVQAVEQLAFVLVDSLHLQVQRRRGEIRIITVTSRFLQVEEKLI